MVLREFVVDFEKRRIIEKAMDETINEIGDLLGTIEPFLEKLNIESSRDFALGYLVGLTKSLGLGMSGVGGHRNTNEEKLQIEKMVMDRLPDMRARVEREFGR